MKQVTVREVPESVLDVVREEAAARHQSLSGFIRALLVAEAERLQDERRRRQVASEVQADLTRYRAANRPWLADISSRDVVASVRAARDEL